MNLPAGTWASASEYLTECPSCGRMRCFINPSAQAGHCKRAACGLKLIGKEAIYEAFGLDPEDDDWEGTLSKPKSFKSERGYRLEGLVPAWLDASAQAYLGKRGLDGEVCKEAQLRYAVKLGRLVIDIDPYTQDLRPQQAVRQPKDGVKWYPSLQGTSLTEYCYGWRLLKPENKGILLVEGIFDLCVLRCIGYGLALMGTQITPTGVELISQRFKSILLWTDPDVAGRKFIDKYTKQFEAQGSSVWVLEHGDPKFMRPQRKKEDARLCRSIRKFCLTGQV